MSTALLKGLTRHCLAVAGAFVAGIALLTLLGRVGGWPGLVTLWPGGTPMAFTSAVGLLAASIALSQATGRHRTLARILGACLCGGALGLLTLYAAGASLGWPELSYDPTYRAAGRGLDGRPSPAMLVGFVMLGYALHSLAGQPQRFRRTALAASALLALSLFCTLAALLGMRGNEAAWRYIGMSLPSALCYVAASAAILTAALEALPPAERPASRAVPLFAASLALIGLVGALGSKVIIAHQAAQDAITQTLAIRTVLADTRALIVTPNPDPAALARSAEALATLTDHLQRPSPALDQLHRLLPRLGRSAAPETDSVQRDLLGLLATATAAEDAALHEDARAAAQAAAGLTRVITLATIVALGLLALAGTVLYRAQRALRRTHADLAVSESQLRQIFDSPALGVALVALDSSIVQANTTLRTLLDRDEAGLVGRSIRELIHPSDFDATEPLILALREGRLEHTLSDQRLLHQDGRWIPTRIWIALVRDGDGRPLHFVAHIEDVRAQRDAEISRRHALQQLTEVRGALDEHAIVAITDTAFRFTHANARLCSVSGYPCHELEGQPFARLASEPHPAEFIATIHAELLSGRTWRGELSHRRRDGTTYWTESTFTPIPDGDGQTAYIIVIQTDITSNKELGQNLATARDEAVRASRVKSEFLANMSHELRTPLNGVLGIVDLLRESPLTREQHELIQLLGTSGEGLLRIIDDLLDISKIEAGKLRIEPEPFDLAAECRRVLSLLTPRAAAKSLRLEEDISKLPVSLVLGDASRLRQILVNLLGNAIKFTERGQITLHGRILLGTASHITVRLEVQDTGIGMEPAVISKLFRPFSQADASTTRRYGGTGLGLAICRQLVELMGGSIDVESTPGRGTRFWVDLPLAWAPPQTAPATSPSSPALPRTDRPLHLLLVEDNPENRTVARLILERIGHTLDTASNGLEGLMALKRTRYDAVLMDCQMPVLDGLETTRRLRAEIDPHLPVIALTASATKEERTRCLAAGMNGFLAKPIRPHSLQSELDRLLQRRPASTPPTPAPAPAPSADAPHLDPEVTAILRTLPGEAAPDLFSELQGLFLQHLPARREALHQQLAVGDYTPLAQTAHTLAGSAASLGAYPTRDAALRVETAARAGDAAAVRAALPELETALERLAATLHAPQPATVP